MAYTQNPTWHDWPNTDTQHTAATDNNIETGILDASNRLDYAEANLITTGESNYNRSAVALTTGQLTSQVLYLTYITARLTSTVTTMTTYVTTAAAATPTICRIGVYSVAGNGDLTLINSTTNDTALWNATGANSKALSSSWSKVRATRYAIGCLVNTGAAGPTLVCANVTTGAGMYLVLSTPPRLLGILTAQTDLPSSVTEASLVAATSARFPYLEFTP